MIQTLSMLTLVVDDYDEAIDYYVNTLDFELVEDTAQPEQNKRWVIVAPPGGGGAKLLLAKAKNEAQRSRMGDQTGGRVFLFLDTDDFDRDYNKYRARGVHFARDASIEDYGKVAVFADLYGNLWDLVERR